MEDNLKKLVEKLEEIEGMEFPEEVNKVIDENDSNNRYKILKANNKDYSEIIVEKFLLFHRKRASLLEGLDEKIHGKLIFQICFIGFESLAKARYLGEKEYSGKSGKRFIDLLSNAIGENEAIKIYNFGRCPLIHQGYMVDTWTCLEAWGEEETGFISFPKTDSIRSSVELPPKSMIAIYERLIRYLEKYFKEKEVKTIPLK